MFPAFLMPMLIGAGTGALGGLLTGKDPLKGALMGGVTGGLLGPLSGAIGAGGVGAGAASATSAGATGLVGAGNSALGSGIGAGLGAASTPLMSTIPMEGVNAFTESVKPLASNIPNMGVDAFTQQPSMFESFYDTVSPYVDVRDLGSTALKSQLQSQQRQAPTPQSGRVTEGRAPQANDVMALLQAMKMPERRRITLI